MSQTTKEINRVTGTVISVSLKLIVFAVTILLLYEGVTRGYEFGYHVFCDTAAAEEPGVDMRVTIGEGEKIGDIAAALEKGGLIKNRYTFLIQCLFYEYGRSDNPVLPGTYLLNNSMTGKEIILELQGWSDRRGERNRKCRQLNDSRAANQGLSSFSGAGSGRSVRRDLPKGHPG